MPSSRVCVDSNIIIKLAVFEDGSGLARAQWLEWVNDDTEAVAPPLLAYEVTSMLRNKVQRGLLPHDEARNALSELLNVAVSVVSPLDLHERAWELATRFDRPQAYDSHYLAVAEFLGCPFWTADRRLFNSAKGFEPGIHLLGAD